jgi:two-component system sensor kinase FixL
LSATNTTMPIDLTQPVSIPQRITVLAACTAATALLLFGEHHIGPAFPITPLFFLPLLVAAAFVPRWVAFVSAIAVAVLDVVYASPQAGNPATRLALSAVAFSGASLFAGELVQKRRIAQSLALKTRQESRLRSDAAQEIRALIDGTPAAVITVGPDARIAMTNAAARRLLGFGTTSPEGEPIGNFLPILANLLESPAKAGTLGGIVEASGARRQGEPFHAQMWVSSYDSAQGPRLAAILSDVTDNLRDREEAGWRHLLASSKFIAAAVSHEIRNLTGGAAVLHENLRRIDGITANPDFQALGTVIDSLLKLSSEDLADSATGALAGVDVREVLDELRLIMLPAFEQAGSRLEFQIAENLPPVRADHSGLLQVFINLAQNSCRALNGVPHPLLRIVAYQLEASVIIRFSDNGPGPAPGAPLFEPFSTDSSATGLGLFISRSLIRTFGGELHYTRKPGECCFLVEVPALTSVEAARA